jgi:hypothetical protein
MEGASARVRWRFWLHSINFYRPMTIKLLYPCPWDAIQLRASRQKAFVAVPFIGKGAAALLPIPGGSVLVTRFSEAAVRAGQVDPTEILKFLTNKVKVHADNNLHAKVYVFGRTCFIGSANASNSSRKLVEACLQCTDPAIVKGARAMVVGLTGDLLTAEYVRSLINFYPGERPFGAVMRQDPAPDDEPSTGDNNPVTVDGGSRVWVTPLYSKEWGAEVVAVDRVASKDAKAVIDPSKHRLFKANWDIKPSFAVGDWIVTRNGGQRRNFKVEPPARVISIHHVSRKGGYLVYGERPKEMRARGVAAVERSLGSAANVVLYSGSDDRLIRKGQAARAVLQMWSAFRG